MPAAGHDASRARVLSLRAWAYIAGLDVHHARIFVRCETQNGIEPFDRLVEQVMTRPPYNVARRVFWIFPDLDTLAERLLDFQYYLGSGSQTL